MKERPTINSDTFSKIFKNKKDLLAQLASSLTHKNINTYLNNITTDITNKEKLKYIITMPNDNTIIITNTINNKETIINLNKEK